MKALSILQPAASQVMAGVRTFEARPWHTKYRGRLAIHAGGRAPIGSGNLPRGVLLGAVELLACDRVEDLDRSADLADELARVPSGWWIWRFADPIVLAEPRPYRGRLGLFSVDPALFREALGV
jgi:hypothetical protein